VEDVRGRAGFTDAREDCLDAVAMRVGIAVGHRVDGKSHVVSKIEGATSGGFDANAGRDSRQNDLGRAAVAEVLIEIGARKAPNRCLLSR
jgi:hypothetical protein